MRIHGPGRRVVGALLIVAVAFAVVPASPAMAVSCVLNGTTATVVNDSAFLSIGNVGGNLSVNGVSCGAISSMNQVNIDMGNTGSLSFSVFGGLGPGQFDEGDGTSELEFSVTNLPSTSTVGVVGSTQPDGFTVGEFFHATLGLVRQINLNALAEAGGVKDSDVAIRGTPAKIFLNGEAGDDHLSGAGIVSGGRASSVPLDLVGEDGSDTVSGGNADDEVDLEVEDGIDSFQGGGGFDTGFIISVTPTRVSLDGVANDGTFCPSVSCQDNVGTNIEVIHGSSQTDHLIGNAGGQSLVGNAGDDQLFGLGGNDILVGGPDSNFLRGGSGNDLLVHDQGHDTFLGDDGVDTVNYFTSLNGVTVTLDGVPNDGPSGLDEVANDVERVIGSPYEDELIGSSANNRLVGGAGVDVLDGRGGNDTLRGGDQNDRLLGSLGNDSLGGGAQADVMRGGRGRDTVTYASSPAAVVVSLDRTANDGAAAEGDNVASDVENVVGSPYPDRLLGSPAANVFRGGGGADVLRGFGGNDSLYGQAGNDAFNGGAGTDRCSQGPGSGPKVSCER